MVRGEVSFTSYIKDSRTRTASPPDAACLHVPNKQPKCCSGRHTAHSPAISVYRQKKHVVDTLFSDHNRSTSLYTDASALHKTFAYIPGGIPRDANLEIAYLLRAQK